MPREEQTSKQTWDRGSFPEPSWQQFVWTAPALGKGKEMSPFGSHRIPLLKLQSGGTSALVTDTSRPGTSAPGLSLVLHGPLLWDLGLAFALEMDVCVLQWLLTGPTLVMYIKLIAGRAGKLESSPQMTELKRRFKEKSFRFWFVVYFVYILVCVLFCVMDSTSNV